MMAPGVLSLWTMVSVVLARMPGTRCCATWVAATPALCVIMPTAQPQFYFVNACPARVHVCPCWIDPTQSRFVTTAVPHIPDSDDEDDALEEVQTLSLDQVATAALEVSSEPAPAPAPVPIEQLTGSARFKAMQAAHEAKEKAKEKAKRDAARAEAHRNRELLVASSYEPRHAVVFRASVHVHVDEWDLGKPLNFIAVLASEYAFGVVIGEP